MNVIEKKYTGIAAERVMNYSFAKNSISVDTMLEVLSRCTSVRKQTSLRSDMLVKYGDRFMAHHESIIDKWIFRDQFVKLFSPNPFAALLSNVNFSEEFKNKIECGVFKEITKHFVNIYVDFFGMEKTKNYITQMIQGAYNEKSLPNISKSLDRLMWSNQNNSKKVFDFDHNDIQNLYKQFRNIDFKNVTFSDSDYYNIIDFFNRYTTIDKSDLIAKQKSDVHNLVYSWASYYNGLKKMFQEKNITIADAFQYMIEEFTNNEITLPEDFKEKLEAYEVMQKMLRR